MEIAYNLENPDKEVPWLFLAGPTPRSDDVPSWRKQEALPYLHMRDFQGTVIVPEPLAAPFKGGERQYAWEKSMMDHAHCILFWIPRDMATMPALTTNVEWGRYESSGRVILAMPEMMNDLPTKGREYLAFHAALHNVRVFNALRPALDYAIDVFLKDAA